MGSKCVNIDVTIHHGNCCILLHAGLLLMSLFQSTNTIREDTVKVGVYSK